MPHKSYLDTKNQGSTSLSKHYNIISHPTYFHTKGFSIWLDHIGFIQFDTITLPFTTIDISGNINGYLFPFMEYTTSKRTF